MTQGIVGAARHPADAAGSTSKRASIATGSRARCSPSAMPLPTTMTSSDAGASFHYNLPSNYGDIHVGVYNGENYSGSKPTIRRRSNSAARSGRSRRACRCCAGFAAHVVYYDDNYVEATTSASALMGNVTYEHTTSMPASTTSSAKDQTSATAADVDEQGLLDLGDAANAASERRVVRSAAAIRPLTPNTCEPASPSSPARQRHDQSRTARSSASPYWFPHQGNVSDARILLDYDGQRFDNITRRSRSKDDRGPRLVNFYGGTCMKPSKLLADRWPAPLALAAGVAAQNVQINGAGATFPYPIYSKWFSEYNKLHPNVADQLPVDRIGRRHPAGHEADRVLRRHRRPDDRRAAAGGARQDPALPDGARRRRAGLQHSRT